jgi:hypothetical protein
MKKGVMIKKEKENQVEIVNEEIKTIEASNVTNSESNRNCW